MSHEKPAERIPTELPLEKYVQWACQQNRHLYEPPGSGTAFRTPMWEFVRLCAAHSALRGRSALSAFQQIDRIRLRDGNRGFPWEESFLDSDDPRMEFIATWDKVRIPAGHDILDLAVALAKERPLQPRNCISEGYGRFVSIAGWLQQLRPGNYINLPVERLGTILKVDPRTVSHYAAFAKSNRLITLIAKAHKPSRQAARYVFHCDRFNMESGEELPPAKDPHFHKECKESEDCKDSKENHEQGKSSRTSMEGERHSGREGLGVDFQRKEGNPRALRASKIDANPPSGRREELKRQCEFLEAKMKRN